jgi:putative membrane protein
MFYEAGVANTNSELGLLVYLSLFERQLEVISDRGVLKGLPPAEWNEALFELHQAGRVPDVQTFVQALKTLGDSLAKHLPAASDNPDELPNLLHFEVK